MVPGSAFDLLNLLVAGLKIRFDDLNDEQLRAYEFCFRKKWVGWEWEWKGREGLGRPLDKVFLPKVLRRLQVKTSRFNEDREPPVLIVATPAGRQAYARHVEEIEAPTSNESSEVAIPKTSEVKSAAKKPRKRRQSDPRPLTPIQAEAVQIVGECQGDIAKAARHLGKDRKTVEQNYEAGMAKLAATGSSDNKRKPGGLPTGLRDDAEVTADDDRRARNRPRDRRLD
jgi:hypothetical protein